MRSFDCVPFVLFLFLLVSLIFNVGKLKRNNSLSRIPRLRKSISFSAFLILAFHHSCFFNWKKNWKKVSDLWIGWSWLNAIFQRLIEETQLRQSVLHIRQNGCYRNATRNGATWMTIPTRRTIRICATVGFRPRVWWISNRSLLILATSTISATRILNLAWGATTCSTSPPTLW